MFSGTNSVLNYNIPDLRLAIVTSKALSDNISSNTIVLISDDPDQPFIELRNTRAAIDALKADVREVLAKRPGKQIRLIGSTKIIQNQAGLNQASLNVFIGEFDSLRAGDVVVICKNY